MQARAPIGQWELSLPDNEEMRGRFQAGDIVDVLDADGTNLTFRVQRLASYAYDQPPPDLFSPDGPKRLSLITCAGSWDSAVL